MFNFRDPHFGTMKLPVRSAPHPAAARPPAVVFAQR
jgi:hypothetical protein